MALWWAPGPNGGAAAEQRPGDAEATYGADPRQLEVSAPTETFETDWQGQTAFEFPETWPGREGGPGRTWVIQGLTSGSMS